MTFFYIYFILVLISSFVWLFCCKSVSEEENKYLDNIVAVAFINCLCLPLFVFSYFILVDLIKKITRK